MIQRDNSPARPMLAPRRIAMLASVVGVGIAGVTIIVFLAITRDLRALARLRLIDGVLAIAVVAAPWHHAMVALHGADFARELFLYNQWSRFGAGVHGERSGALGYFG